jgi:hypothetical protein
MTEFTPFNLKTEERQALRQSIHQLSASENNLSVQGSSSNFKAREMPKYKFF